MKTSKLIILYAISCVLLLNACSIRHQYIPELHPLDPGRFGPLNSIKISEQVYITNVQESKEEILIGSVAVHDYYGSLHDITESAVKHAKAELAKREVNIEENSEKSLTLRVTSARMERGTWVLRAIIDMDVVTGTGLKKTYHVENVTPTNVPRAYNGAAAIAVIKMFSDLDILEYLSETDS